MDTQRSYVTYPTSHGTLVAPLGLSPNPLDSKFSSPSCRDTAPPRVKVNQVDGENGTETPGKKGVKLFRAKSGEQERRKGKKKGGKRRQRIWVGETKKREFMPKIDDIL